MTGGAIGGLVESFYARRQRAIQIELAGKPIRIIEPHDLIAMKLRAGRLKDDYDISQIALGTPIDENRLSSLVSSEQLARFAEIKKRS